MQRSGGCNDAIGGQLAIHEAMYFELKLLSSIVFF